MLGLVFEAPPTGRDAGGGRGVLRVCCRFAGTARLLASRAGACSASQNVGLIVPAGLLRI